MPLVINNQINNQQQQQAAAANAVGNQQPAAAGAAAAAAPAPAFGHPFGIMSEVVTTITPQAQQQNRPEVDWTPLADLRCLMQLSLKSSGSHVVAAAQQLGQLKHNVKNLKLEAQGLKVTELELVGQQLASLPYLTWLALMLQYRPVRPAPRPPKRWPWLPRQAAPGAGSSSSSSSGAAAAGEVPAPLEPAAAAGGGVGAAGGGLQGLQGLAAGSNPHGSAGWAWEPAEQLSRQLMQQLPGTALELKVRPHGWY
jgi:hypothetical protein